LLIIGPRSGFHVWTHTQIAAYNIKNKNPKAKYCCLRLLLLFSSPSSSHMFSIKELDCCVLGNMDDVDEGICWISVNFDEECGCGLIILFEFAFVVPFGIWVGNVSVVDVFFRSLSVVFISSAKPPHLSLYVPFRHCTVGSIVAWKNK
jgi:hypothetical protein